MENRVSIGEVDRGDLRVEQNQIRPSLSETRRSLEGWRTDSEDKRMEIEGHWRDRGLTLRIKGRR